MLGNADAALWRATNDIVAALWRTDTATALHSERVARIAADVATELRLAPDQVARTTIGGLLHDAGKLRCDLDILTKPGALTHAERGVIELHPVHGDEVLARAGIPDDIRRIARAHHERLDGTGYPDHLVGDQIPIEVRIVSAVDVYEAIRGLRPYRAPVDHAEAMVELQRRVGWHLDANVVAAIDRVLG